MALGSTAIPAVAAESSRLLTLTSVSCSGLRLAARSASCARACRRLSAASLSHRDESVVTGNELQTTFASISSPASVALIRSFETISLADRESRSWRPTPNGESFL